LMISRNIFDLYFKNQNKSGSNMQSYECKSRWYTYLSLAYKHIILPFMLRSSMWSVSDENSFEFLIFPMRATWPDSSNRFWLDHSYIWLNANYEALHCVFLHPLTSSLFGPNILLSIPQSVLKVKDVSHQYKSNSKNIGLLHILIIRYLSWRCWHTWQQELHEFDLPLSLWYLICYSLFYLLEICHIFKDSLFAFI
jgi:hypothetical protein